MQKRKAENGMAKDSNTKGGMLYKGITRKEPKKELNRADYPVEPLKQSLGVFSECRRTKLAGVYAKEGSIGMWVSICRSCGIADHVEPRYQLS